MQIVKILTFFSITFTMIIFLWLNIKTVYHTFLIKFSSIILNIFYGFKLFEIDNYKLTFIFKSSAFIIEIDNLDSITFNLPLTITIILIMLYGLKDKLKLFFLSLLFVIFFHIITLALSMIDISKELSFTEINYSFVILEKFLIDYIIKAEPFLIGFLIWIFKYKRGFNVD